MFVQDSTGCRICGKSKGVTELEAKKKILFLSKLLHQNGWLAACDGNVSVRLGNDRILITPSQKHKGFLETDDIAVITLDGETVRGNPSSEKLMHLSVYRKSPEAVCVVHAHPPTAIAWSVAHPHLKELPSEFISETILAVGSIPIVPYARPGTKDMGDALEAFLPHRKVMILGRHGALSWGETIDEAYNGMERLEHMAHTLMLALQIHSASYASQGFTGGLTPLSHDEILALNQMRQKIGSRTL